MARQGQAAGRRGPAARSAAPTPPVAGRKRQQRLQQRLKRAPAATRRRPARAAPPWRNARCAARCPARRWLQCERLCRNVTPRKTRSCLKVELCPTTTTRRAPVRIVRYRCGEIIHSTTPSADAHLQAATCSCAAAATFVLLCRRGRRAARCAALPPWRLQGTQNLRESAAAAPVAHCMSRDGHCAHCMRHCVRDEHATCHCYVHGPRLCKTVAAHAGCSLQVLHASSTCTSQQHAWRASRMHACALPATGMALVLYALDAAVQRTGPPCMGSCTRQLRHLPPAPLPRAAVNAGAAAQPVYAIQLLPPPYAADDVAVPAA